MFGAPVQQASYLLWRPSRDRTASESEQSGGCVCNDRARGNVYRQALVPRKPCILTVSHCLALGPKAPTGTGKSRESLERTPSEPAVAPHCTQACELEGRGDMSLSIVYQDQLLFLVVVTNG